MTAWSDTVLQFRLGHALRWYTMALFGVPGYFPRSHLSSGTALSAYSLLAPQGPASGGTSWTDLAVAEKAYRCTVGQFVSVAANGAAGWLGTVRVGNLCDLRRGPPPCIPLRETTVADGRIALRRRPRCCERANAHMTCHHPRPFRLPPSCCA